MSSPSPLLYVYIYIYTHTDRLAAGLSLSRLRMVRKCSHCGHNGHNSRTCCSSTRGMAGGEGGGVKLFGVQLRSASPLKKSFSMECLVSCTYPFAFSSSPSSSTSSLGSVDEAADQKMANGYLSDGPGGRKQERKKGLSWTEEEHRRFLAGLEKLGKGDWRGISRNFVTTRTPTQVASHAQKYFLRQSNLDKKKRRSSLFDVATGEKAARHTDSGLSLCTMASQGGFETAKIDLNSSIQGQETDHLPSSVGLDLELRISSSRLNQKISMPGNLCLGTTSVT
ncbi:transcription factor MYBS3-like isoform X2 [Zingiber officinale]|uniref:transcription factor MYBS3-like isoform X2 n=1 Tax=Zingiber officinale TaxID=94328 RepID=UPI001C4B1B9A|nr:transcription factor MYBS3-like isoform X2 [Zingiber officinale]